MINLKSKALPVSKTNKPISKTLKVFFIVIQAVFLFDFGFIKYKSRVKLIVKISSAIISTILVIYVLGVIFSDMKLFDIGWQSTFILRNYAYVIILLIIPERNTFCMFLEQLQGIDAEVNANDISDYIDVKILLYCITSFVCKIVSSSAYCAFYGEGCIKRDFAQAIFSIIVSSLDIPLVVFYCVFHTARRRLVALRKSVNDEKLTAKQGLLLYKSLIDLVRNTKKTYDPIFIVTLLANIPIVMTTIYVILKEVKTGWEDPYVYVSDYVSMTFLTVSIFAPAIAAESLSTEVDNIKIILHDMLLTDEGEDQKQDIMSFITYIEARPFKFRVLKVIPLDAMFPVVVLDVCVTYLIVILQLTHIY